MLSRFKLGITKIGHVADCSVAARACCVAAGAGHVGEQEKANASKICNASAVVAAAVVGGRNIEVLPLTTAAATNRIANRWDGNPPSLLKLTSGTTPNRARSVSRSDELLRPIATTFAPRWGITDDDINFANHSGFPFLRLQ